MPKRLGMPVDVTYIQLHEQPTTAMELWQILTSLMSGVRNIMDFMPVSSRLLLSRWAYVIDIGKMASDELLGFEKTLEGFGRRIANNVFEVFAGILYYNAHPYALYHMFSIDEEDGVLLYYDELHDVSPIS